MDLDKENKFFFHEYSEATRQSYPELSNPKADKKFGWLNGGQAGRIVVASDKSLDLFNRPTRFQAPTSREPRGSGMAWAMASSEPSYTARFSHKGLLNVKPPFDLVLYSNLIWEVQPGTIIELGALQGGSALWYADQLDVLCGKGEVHSFEKAFECISPRAKHPRLTFHRIDLEKLESFDTDLLDKLPHPWIVVDDAHANLLNVFKFLDKRMKPDDYYIIEDEPTRWNAKDLSTLFQFAETNRYVVDTNYTDAFGYNMTCAPNAWFKKT